MEHSWGRLKDIVMVKHRKAEVCVQDREKAMQRDDWEVSCVYTEEEMPRGREEKRKEYV